MAKTGHPVPTPLPLDLQTGVTRTKRLQLCLFQGELSRLMRQHGDSLRWLKAGAVIPSWSAPEPAGLQPTCLKASHCRADVALDKQGQMGLGNSECSGPAHSLRHPSLPAPHLPQQHLLCVVGLGEQLAVPQQLLLLATSMPHWCCWLRRRTSSRGFAGVCQEARTAVMPPPWLREAAAGLCRPAWVKALMEE